MCCSSTTSAIWEHVLAGLPSLGQPRCTCPTGSLPGGRSLVSRQWTRWPRSDRPSNAVWPPYAEVLQGAPSRACWPRRGVNKLATPLGNKDLAIMADLSDLSVKLFEEYTRERWLADKRLFLYCFRKTEQGVIRIKEWHHPPSTYWKRCNPQVTYLINYPNLWIIILNLWFIKRIVQNQFLLI
jgi:hypothetical protein